MKGQIAPEEDGLMFTSIPYDSGWTAYVDGKKTEIQTVAGAFIALDLKAGAHTIVFKYFPRGLSREYCSRLLDGSCSHSL